MRFKEVHLNPGTKIKISKCFYPDLIGSMGIVVQHIYSHLPDVLVQSLYRGNPVKYAITVEEGEVVR